MGAGRPGPRRDGRSSRVLLVLVLAAALVAAGGTWWWLRADAPRTTAAQPVVRDGELLDDRTGDPWVPRGVVWSSFELACAQGWGYSALDALDAAGGADAAASDQADVLASWGADTVRLPLNQDCWLGTRGAPVSDAFAARTPAGYRAAVDSFVAALNERGVVVVLALHSRKRIGSPAAGTLAMPDSESLAFWRSVASRYAGRPSVLFDAFHEPHSRVDAAGREVFTLGWGCWRDGGCRPPVEDDGVPVKTGGPTYDAQGMADVVVAIRQAGATQPVLLGGLERAQDLGRWAEYTVQDDQLVASVHVTSGEPGSADGPACGPRCWAEVLAPLADRVPVLATELGADSGDGRVADFLAWAERHDVGVLARAWTERPGDPQALVEDLTGRPTAWGGWVRSWLQERRTGR